MTKKVINKCPICGGDISVYANTNVCVAIGEDGSAELITGTQEILDDVLGQIGQTRDYRVICDDCGCNELHAHRLPNGDFEVSSN